MKKIIVFVLCIGLLNSCNKTDVISHVHTSDVSRETDTVTLVSKEVALDILNDFMQRVEGGLLPTKSGQNRVIESFDTYYKEGVTTKSVNGTLPSAYIVNYANNEGFAVIGANTDMPPIVAVTEKGTLNPVTLEIIISNEGTNEISGSDDIDFATFDFYCSADDDYYVIGNEQFVGEMIGNVLIGPGAFLVPNNPGVSENPVQTVEPLLYINWGQGQWNVEGVYNKYCIKNNGKYAYSGCSTVSLAMIMAHNEFPKTLKVNNSELDWIGMKKDKNPSNLDTLAQEDVSLLYGAIYNNVDHLSASSGTLITPRQIELLMKRCRYSNVTRHCNSDFSESMLRITETHLRDGKPLFVSAIKNINVFNGHSWVIDGMTHDIKGNRLLHFNFGWGGDCNGYFSLACFNPARAKSYDTPQTSEDLDYYGTEYNNHFRLISYDIPDTQDVVNISF